MRPTENPQKNDDSTSVLAVARGYSQLGLSIIPVKLDGSKEPAISGWRAYAERQPADFELRTWFAGPMRHGIGIPGGAASGNLIVLDFETLDGFCQWGRALNDDERAALAGSPVIRTPKGGRHVYVRAAEPIKGCKLARRTTGETLIETRGSNHYVVAPGSPIPVHSAGVPYTIAREGWLDGSPFAPMPVELFNMIAMHAIELNEYVRPAGREVVGDRQAGAVGDRPGDHFNGRANWGDILGPHGWKVFRSIDTTTYWCRPGKKPAGISASTGHCRGKSGMDLFYVFSTSALPFEAEVSYSRFAVYTLLNHHGDYRAASRALGLAGYGAPHVRILLSGKAVTA